MSTEFTEAECQGFRDAASDYLDGHSASQAHQMYQRHLDDCRSCREFLDDLEVVLRALGELRINGLTEGSQREALRLYRDQYPMSDTSEPDAQPESQEGLWEELVVLPPPHRGGHVARNVRFQSPNFCEWLMIESERVFKSSPGNALELVEAAIAVGNELRTSKRTSDLLAGCWSTSARCRQSLSDFAGARRDLGFAEGHFKQSDMRETTRARLLMAGASLCSTLGQTEEAIDKYNETVRIYENRGQRYHAACMKVSLGATYLRADRTDEAMEALQEALAMIDAQRDPPLASFGALLNLSIAHCELEEPDEAEKLLPRLTELSAQLEADWGIHLRWLVGSIARARGEWDQALRVFCKVREYFKMREEWVHYLESSLDVARVHLARSDWDALESLIAETDLAARSMAVETESLQALRLLEQAVAQQALNETQLRAFATLLGRLSARRGASF